MRSIFLKKREKNYSQQTILRGESTKKTEFSNLSVYFSKFCIKSIYKIGEGFKDINKFCKIMQMTEMKIKHTNIYKNFHIM